jgi:amino acid permease
MPFVLLGHICALGIKNLISDGAKLGCYFSNFYVIVSENLYILSNFFRKSPSHFQSFAIFFPFSLVSFGKSCNFAAG